MNYSFSKGKVQTFTDVEIKRNQAMPPIGQYDISKADKAVSKKGR